MTRRTARVSQRLDLMIGRVEPLVTLYYNFAESKLKPPTKQIKDKTMTQQEERNGRASLLRNVKAGRLISLRKKTQVTM